MTERFYMYKKNTIPFSNEIFKSVKREGKEKKIWENMLTDAFLLNIYLKEYNKEDVKKKTNKIKRDKIRRIKRRWAKDVLSQVDLENPHPELSSYLSGLKEIEKIEEKLPKSERIDISMRIERIKENIKEWKEDDTLLLSDYPFFDQKDLKTQRKSIEVDVMYIVGKNILSCSENHITNEWENKVFYHPILLPLFPKEEVKVFENNNGKYIYQKELGLNTISYEYKELKVDVIRNKMGNKIELPIFSLRDIHLLSVLHSFWKEQTSQRTTDAHSLCFPMSECLSELESSDSSKAYYLLEKRLNKFLDLKISFLDSQFRIFESFRVKEEKQKMIDIVFSSSIIDQWMKDKYESYISRKEINTLTPEAQALLLFVRSYEKKKSKIYIEDIYSWLSLEDIYTIPSLLHEIHTKTDAISYYEFNDDAITTWLN